MPFLEKKKGKKREKAPGVKCRIHKGSILSMAGETILQTFPPFPSFHSFILPLPGLATASRRMDSQSLVYLIVQAVLPKGVPSFIRRQPSRMLLHAPAYLPPHSSSSFSPPLFPSTVRSSNTIPTRQEPSFLTISTHPISWTPCSYTATSRPQLS